MLFRSEKTTAFYHSRLWAWVEGTLDGYMTGVLRLEVLSYIESGKTTRKRSGREQEGVDVRCCFGGEQRKRSRWTGIMWREACLMVSGRMAWVVCTRMALHRKGGAREVDDLIDAKNLSQIFRGLRISRLFWKLEELERAWRKDSSIFFFPFCKFWGIMR